MSGEVHRTTTTNETLTLLPCPYCNGPVIVKELGYSVFNPGTAQCKPCRRRWNLGFVADEWGAGLIWNNRQPYMKELDQLRARIKEIESIIKG